jgi:hypothetical protein
MNAQDSSAALGYPGPKCGASSGPSARATSGSLAFVVVAT